MKREDLLKEMRESIGTKDPIVFFDKMVSAFEIMFEKLESLEKDLNKVKTNSALSIQWDPKVASDMLVRQIEVLRQDKLTYHNELHDLKAAYVIGDVVKDYETFCSFWLNVLGYHPFLD